MGRLFSTISKLRKQFMIYQCPLCQSPLSFILEHKQLGCANNHRFDQAKQGYFNLLPVQRKKSKEPGDSKEMIAARESFLTANHYQPLAENLKVLIAELVLKHSKLLDIGCGEGYYSRQVNPNDHFISYGFDISKPAVIKAAKKHQTGSYSVASSEEMPFQSETIDAAFKVYAPVNELELHRIMKSGGYFINVTPAPRHLWQLREFIYEEVREHATQDTLFTGLEKMSSQQLSYQITPSPEDRLRLLDMTPFAWKANGDARRKISERHDLAIELDFLITVFKKP